MIAFEKTFIEDLFIVKPDIYLDNRGYFFESYSKLKFKDSLLEYDFVQDNTSFSISAGTLRGLHYQHSPFEQTKLVFCLQGSIFDVAVDLRKNSKTYMKWFAIELNSENHFGLLIPRGFAHGFQTLKDNTIVNYKVDNPYHKKSERLIIWNDPKFDISWPMIHPILSDKDKDAPFYL